MAESALITIRRQLLDVDMHGTEADGLALQRRLPRLCTDVLAPAIESALSRIDPGDAYLYVERLAIEVSVASLDRLETELANSVRRAVEDHVRRNPLVPTDTAVMAGSPRVASAAGDVQQRTVTERVDEALLEFLDTGRLPWSFQVPPGSRLEHVVFDTWAVAVDNHRGPTAATRSRLRRALGAPHARARLAMQFTPEFVMTVLRSISPALAATIETILSTLEEVLAEAPTGPVFTRRLWDVVLETASSGHGSGPGELIRTAWMALGPVEREDHALAAAFERQWPSATERRDEPPLRDAIDAPAAQPSPALPRLPDRDTALEEIPGGALHDHAGILHNHAGVVLLHPFLPRFFEGLGVAEGDQLLDPGRAVCLMHHLATGGLVAPEHELTLAKVLCGVPLGEPVEADVGLTDVEVEETTALLEAAIGHWEALRSTSPVGLRTEFLTRPGMLSVDAHDDWLLRVESRTVDILLDQLPWGLSMVKLPWMSRLMRVEWR